MIEIADHTAIREEEITYRTSRSGGPGGQSVNKLNTRVTALFDVLGSPSLLEDQKRRIQSALSTRIDKRGVLHVVSQKHRSQEANRQVATERLQQLLQEALKVKAVRKKTKVPAAAQRRRLEAKRQRSLLKQQRTKMDWGED